jgi:hypothetical protein
MEGVSMADDNQRNLTCMWLNIIGAGIVSAGTVTQMIALTNEDATISGVLRCLLVAFACGAIGTVLHLAARHLMRNG